MQLPNVPMQLPHPAMFPRAVAACADAAATSGDAAAECADASATSSDAAAECADASAATGDAAAHYAEARQAPQEGGSWSWGGPSVCKPSSQPF